MSADKIKVLLATLVLVFSAGASDVVRAEPLEISDAPLFIATSVEPNVLFMLDDSGSMRWGFMPDELDQHFNMCSATGDWAGFNGIRLCYSNNNREFLASSHLNKIYYNPEAEYTPPIKPDGTPYPAADFDSAPVNGYLDEGCGWYYDGGLRWSHCVDMRDDYRALMDPYFYGGGRGFAISRNAQVEPAFYYVNTGTPGCDGSRNSACYSKVSYGDSGFDEQNFANWFSYYRTREMVAKAGVGFAFHEQGSAMRVGYDAINGNYLDRGVRRFQGDDREDFFEWLYGDEANGGTPLRAALKRAGEYFEDDEPWRTDPDESDSELLTCRQSYTVLMTDGYYDDNESVGLGNTDGAAGSQITGPNDPSFTYSPSSPFEDDRSNTLADVAMEYWKRDLRDDIDNQVPTTDSNPAFWQHMVTFGVGLGVEGTISSDDAFGAITDSDIEIDWPSPFETRPGKIDDLLHAAVNSRGGFFNASDPQQFAENLSSILAEVIARANSTTSVAVSSTRLDAGSFLYRASFDSEDWSGELIADDVIEGDTYYASEELADMNSSARNILTFIPSGGSDGVGDGEGVEFTGALVSELGGRLELDADGDEDLWTVGNVIDYIRGDDSLEGEGEFRVRNKLLGDVINSRPVASTAGNDGWGRVDDDYLDYIAEYKNDPRDCPETGTCDYERKDTVFVGANDGMLHAFDGRTLEEYFSYIPATLHDKLKHLPDEDYTHRFYVDGQIAVGDANIDGSWGTYLVGTLGAGGRGVYALDVTDPENFGEDDVLWELTSDDDPDIGYTYGEPVITRLGDGSGTWVAIFGNGYNSQDRQAYLFVVDLSNGEVLQKVDVGEAGSNGLSGVASWKDPVEGTHVRRVYAGDLEGTMWRFDFDSGSASSAFGDDGLFEAGRPIMSRPSLGANPGGGLMVYFGTGKLVEKSDKTDTSQEWFFAIRDLNGTVEFSQLAAAGLGGGVGGWYEELSVDGRLGEKVFGPPTLEFGLLFYSTFEPISDACTPGGNQWQYRREPFSGGGEPPKLIGVGAPIAPPVTVRPPGPPEGDVPFPGNPNPGDEGGPPDFPDPPDPTGGDPEGWCSAIQIPPLVEGGPWIDLGMVCEGRQIWREVR